MVKPSSPSLAPPRGTHPSAGSADAALSFLATASQHWALPDDPRVAEAIPFHPWLLDPHSLTARLQTLSRDNFAVSVVDESWQDVTQPELLERFGRKEEENGRAQFWSRKVVLTGCDEPWVVAHTLVPRVEGPSSECGLGALGEILSLGSRPLGEWLFAQADMTRSPIELCRVDKHTWGRRSVFFTAAGTVMVIELFLPALLISPCPS